MEKTIRSIKTPIRSCVRIPGSKSITNRALILASLAQGTSELHSILLSDDTRACIEALKNLGVEITLTDDASVCTVVGHTKPFPRQEATIFCHHAGTVARFLLPVCAAAKGKYQFNASPQLSRRPLAHLLDVLAAQGAIISSKSWPLLLQSNGLAGGEITIDATETSQFFSGLLMAAPFAKTNMILKTNRNAHYSYVNMTRHLMRAFGVEVDMLDSRRCHVPLPQCYSARQYTIEPDFSTASYFFAAAAVTQGEVTVPLLSRKQSIQGDVAFLDVLEKMGCEISEKNNGVSVQGPPILQGIDVNMRFYSDTFMTLAAIAPFANSPTTIRNIGHTRHQESDRIAVMCHELNRLQVKVEEGDDWLRIYPSMPQAGEVDSHDDHRIAMAFALIGLRISGVVISGAECVAKTCPDFFKLWDEF